MDRQAVVNLELMREHELKMHTPITDRLARLEVKLTIILGVLVPVAAGFIIQAIYWMLAMRGGV